MHYRDVLLFTFTSALWASSAHATRHYHERAVKPTAGGQIGVNPVTAEPGEKYVSIVGPATPYYEADGGTTKWIGVNSEYLTQEVVTSTVDNVPTEITKNAPVIFATATKAADGQNAGDVAVIMGPKLIETLNSLAEDAAKACAGKKRQACNRAAEFARLAQAELSPGGRLATLFSHVREGVSIPTVAAADVAAAVSTVQGAAPILSTLVFAYIVAQHLNRDTPKFAPVNNIPSDMNTPTKEKESDVDGCPTTAPKGIDAPICQDSECKGSEEVQLCTVGPWKHCECLLAVTGLKQERDPKWLEEQQTILQWIIDNDVVRPWCRPGASPSSGKFPIEYCVCGGGGEDPPATYSVAESSTKPHNPCPYTTAPGPTVVFSDRAAPTAAPKEEPKPICSWYNACDDIKKQLTYGDPWVHLKVATEKGYEFCNKHRGKTLSGQKLEELYDDSPKHKWWNGKQAQFNVRAWTDADDLNLHLAECKLAVDIVLNGCDTCSSDEKWGGQVTVDGLTLEIFPIPEVPNVVEDR